MSVPSGILAVLTLGPAYGLQIHGELENRMGKIGRINVGQIYSTLERLQNRGLVSIAGLTHDGLPRYALTNDGTVAAREWLTTAPAGGGTWDQMVGHVLVAVSIPDAEPGRLLNSYLAELSLPSVSPARPQSAETATHTLPAAAVSHSALGSLAAELRTAAAVSWITSVLNGVTRGDSLAMGRDELRPPRGRRPRSVG